LNNKDLKAVVRRIASTGATNMFFLNNVISIAEAMGEYEVALWIREHKAEYGTLILYGKLPGDEEEGDAE